MSYSQALEEQVRIMRRYSLRAAPGDGPGWRHDEGVPFMLQQCEPFYWAPDICSTISQLPADGLEQTILREEMLPVSGFWWLATPIDLPKWDRDGTHLRAIAYARYSSFIEFRTFHHFWGLRNGVDYFTLFKWRYGQSLHDAEIQSYATPGPHDGGRISDEWQRSANRLFVAMLLFIEQRILIAPQQRAERHTRKRLAAEGYQHEPLVRVVELRRKAAHSEHHGDSEPVEWSHQWIVSGHWRQQWYQCLNVNQPRWIMPYVKGPEDKPLKPPRAKVFAVVR